MEQNTNNSIYPLTLGKKIKKLRLLRGLSQKELGIKVGFSPETADTRIRQYEKDAMAPKSEIRNKLAEALDVDISALSDNAITGEKDIMQMLFFLEENYGMTIQKKDDDSFCFNISSDSLTESKSDILMDYLRVWYEGNLRYHHKGIKKAKIDTSSDRQYLLWKTLFIKEFSNGSTYMNEQNKNLLIPFTLGNRIKYYRLLRGLTQKDLGTMMGFSDSTAAIRIRQYEADIKVPKQDIRQKFADVLEIDISVLNDLSIQNEIEIMRTLFLLNRILGFEIDNAEGRFILSFDEENDTFPTLMKYLHSWHKQTEKLKKSDYNAEAYEAYEQWEAHFPKNSGEKNGY